MFQVVQHLHGVAIQPEHMAGLVHAVSSVGDQRTALPFALPDDLQSNSDLCEIFNSLLFMKTAQSRMDHLEAEVFKVCFSKLDEQRRTQLQTVLMNWWLALYNCVYGIAPYTRE